MVINSKTTLSEFLYIIDLFRLDDDKIKEIFDKIEKTPLTGKYSKPFTSLNISQLDDLTNQTTDFYRLVTVPFNVIYGISEKDVLTMPAIKTIRQAFYFRDEIKKTVKMFDELKSKPTAEEIAAGIHRIDSDFFSLCDWYCHRQGIASHDEVAKINWMVIYKALKLDYQTNMFKIRLQNNIERKNKQK